MPKTRTLYLKTKQRRAKKTRKQKNTKRRIGGRISIPNKNAIVNTSTLVPQQNNTSESYHLEMAEDIMTSLPNTIQNHDNLQSIYSLIGQRLYEFQSEGDTSFEVTNSDIPELNNTNERSLVIQLFNHLSMLSQETMSEFIEKFANELS